MLPEERANEAGDLSAEDLEILGELPPSGSTSSVTEEKAGSSTAAAGDTPEDDPADDELEEVVADDDKSDDPDADEDDDEKDDPDSDGKDADKGDKDGDKPDEVEDEDLQLPDPEVVTQYHQQFAQTREAYLTKLVDHYKPVVESARSNYDKAMEEILAIDKKYEKDEDGWSPPVDYKDVLRRQELHATAKENEAALEEIAQKLPQQQARIEAELYIKTNVAAYPGLAKYEHGFRELINQGVKFGTVEQAIILSRAMQQSLGKEPLQKGKAPTRQQVIKQVEEDKIKQREALKIGAGKKGSAGSSAPKSKGDNYSKLGSKVRNDMRYFDTLMEVK